jgi:hypothetical protein
MWIYFLVYKVVAAAIAWDGTQSDEDSDHNYWVLN